VDECGNIYHVKIYVNIFYNGMTRISLFYLCICKYLEMGVVVGW